MIIPSQVDLTCSKDAWYLLVCAVACNVPSFNILIALTAIAPNANAPLAAIPNAPATPNAPPATTPNALATAMMAGTKPAIIGIRP